MVERRSFILLSRRPPSPPLATISKDDGNAFDGVAFHCHAGSVLNKDAFHNDFPSTVSYLQILCNNTVFLNKCSLYTLQNIALEHMAVIGGKI